MNMTHDEMIAVIQAHKEGKEIQFKGESDSWLDVTVATPNWNFYDRVYRVKPTPTKRLMRMDDLPAVFWVRCKGVSTWFLATEVCGNTLCTVQGPDLDLKDHEIANFEWSPDRKTVHSFEVEE